MTIWSFAVQDGNPGISQVVHQREGMHYVHWHTECISAHPHGKAYTEILPVHSHWLSVPVQLGCLLLGIYEGGKVSPRGQSPCLPGLLAYLRLIPCTGQFGPASVAAPRLGDPFQQVWFATRTAVQFHLYVSYIIKEGGFFIQCSHGEHQWSICLRLCEQGTACLRITIPGPGGHIRRCHASAVGWEWCTPSHHSKCYRLYSTRFTVLMICQWFW